MNIYICETLYHVMLAVLLIEGTDNIIICTTHEEKNMENFYALNTSVIHEANFIMRFRNPKSENLGVEMLKDRTFLYELKRKYGFNDFNLCNFAWSVNSIDRSSAYFYKKSKQVILYEEGAMGSIGVPQSKKKLIVKKLLGIPVAYHQDEKIKEVRVQTPSLYDDRFGDKIKSFSLSELMANSEVGDRVLELFLPPESAKSLMDLNGGIIVFTQPLSEDGYISEDEKINMYRTICEWFGNAGVILKVHPRDTSTYKFKNTSVIKKIFPSELFDVLGISFEIAIGICTSAINNVKVQRGINLNPNFLKDKVFDISEMEKRFGGCNADV